LSYAAPLKRGPRQDEAENTRRRASERKLEIPDFFVLRYVIAFLKGDKVGMEDEVALAREQRGTDDWMSNSEGFVLAYSGHLEAARKMSQLAADLARQTERRDTEALYEADAAVREALFGNVSAARQRAVHAFELSMSRDVAYGVGVKLALSGDSSRSQGVTEDLSRRLPEDTRVQFHIRADTPRITGVEARPAVKGCRTASNHDPLRTRESNHRRF
jgi:hypothetical protein